MTSAQNASTSPLNAFALLAMIHRLMDVTAGLDDIVREAEHVGIAAIAGDDISVGIVEDQPLRHVVEGGVEPQSLRPPAAAGRRNSAG